MTTADLLFLALITVLLSLDHFARETARLRRGVGMFHSDLVYFRENVKALKELLQVERNSR